RRGQAARGPQADRGGLRPLVRRRRSGGPRPDDARPCVERGLDALALMELSPLGFLVVLGVPLALRSSILRALGLGWRTDRVAYLGWAWLAGALSTGALEALRLATGLGSPGPVVALALGLAVALRFLARRTPVLEDAAPEHAAAGWERAFFALALALALVVTLQRIVGSSLIVILDDDDANTWALPAKTIY